MTSRSQRSVRVRLNSLCRYFPEMRKDLHGATVTCSSYLHLGSRILPNYCLASDLVRRTAVDVEALRKSAWVTESVGHAMTCLGSEVGRVGAGEEDESGRDLHRLASSANRR